MKRFLTFLSLAGLTALSFAQSPLEYEEGKVLVKFKPSLKVAGTIQTEAIGARIEREVTQIGWSIIRLAPNMPAMEALAYFKGLDSVLAADPNVIFRADYIPNDPGYSRQYGLKKIQCEPAWDIEKGKSTVTVAVIDTGVDLEHPDLSAKLLPGKDFVNGDDIADDDNGHGTHCAGNVGASTGNGLGTAGVAINCKIIPVKVLNAGGAGSLDWIISGITWAADQKATVLSLSLGHGGGAVQAEEDACNYAFSKNCVVVCAAGNDGTTSPHYPAAYTNNIAVAATDQNDQKADFSTSGRDWCDIAAPGVSIYSTLPDGQYGDESGTSMACPIAAGACALVASRMPVGTRNTAIRARIEQNCDPVGNFIAFGRVNVKKALPTGTGGGGTTLTYKPTAVSMISGASQFGGLPEIKELDNRFFSVTSLPVVRVGQVAAERVTFAADRAGSQIGELSVKVTGSAGTGISCSIFGWDWNANAYTYIGALPLAQTNATKTLVIPANKITSYVSSSRQIVLQLRAVAPTSPVRTAVQFNFRNDQVVLTGTPR